MTSASIFRTGENCCAVARAHRVALLVDGEEYFDAFVRAAERAERTIDIIAWDFDSRMALRFGPDNRPLETLGDFLNRLCEKNAQLRVHILDWDFPMIYGTDREYSPIFGLNWRAHRHIEFRFDDTHPVSGSHHQKIVVIDDKVAFAGGFDLTNSRWDSPQHAPDDPRRMFEGVPYPPFHDVMIAVDGDAAAELAAIVRQRWHWATGHKPKPARPTDGDPWPPDQRVDMEDVSLGIACTYPPIDGNGCVNHVESLYLEMIAGARDYIYIENQYFTSKKVGDALEARLAAAEGPEIVLVTRVLSHGWLEEMTMQVLRTCVVRRLRAADVHGRFHAFFPDVEGLREGTCLDLHSKVMIVDDEWLRVGSSNISNRSMGVDTECDVVVEARGDAQARDAIRAFRDRLLAEHSGVDVEAMREALAQNGSMAAATKASGSPGRHLSRLEAPEVSEALTAAAALGDMEQPISLDSLAQDLAHEESEAPRAKRWPYILVAGLVVILGLALAWRYTPLAEAVTADAVIDYTQSFAQRWWAPVVLVLAYTPASLVMFPRPLITLAAVVAFGAWAGLAYAMAGMLIAAIAGYAVGRLFHRDTARRIAGPRVARMSKLIQRRGIIAVALVRLVPVAPFQVVNVVMGAVRIRVVDFVAGTFIGVLPGALAATVLSDQVAAALRDPTQVNGWLIGAAVAAFAALAFAGHLMLKRMGVSGTAA